MRGYSKMKITNFIIISILGFFSFTHTFTMKDDNNDNEFYDKLYDDFNQFYGINVENYETSNIKQKNSTEKKPRKTKYKVNDGDTCNICGESDKTKYPGEKLLQHLKTHCKSVKKNEKNKYPCPFPGCIGSATSLSNLKKQHMKVHSKEKQYACLFCPKQFKQLVNLDGHVESKHPEQKKSEKIIYKVNNGNTCNICGESDKTEYFEEKLLEHLKSHCDKNKIKKNKEKKYACPFPGCSKNTVELIHIQRHMNVHSSYQAYKCSICTRSYKFPQELKIHIKEKHEIEQI